MFATVFRLVLWNLVCRQILNVKDKVKLVFVFGSEAIFGRITSYNTHLRDVLDSQLVFVSREEVCNGATDR